MYAIEVDNVTKVYRRHSRRRKFTTLKSALLRGSLVSDLRPDETFAALQDLSLQVTAGGAFGVIGRNGCGKSTLLKLVAGITKPTSGQVTARGRISALIELGAGFHPEISGRENIFINGIMLGLSKKEVTYLFDEIVEFAEMSDFIDAPVKTYSSGMYLRLGFAVAIHVNPDILLVDELLAVGDEEFTHKCLDKFGEFKRLGKTILLVSHALGLVDRFCDEAVWIDEGQAKAIGDPTGVIGAYVIDVGKAEEKELAAVDAKAGHEVKAEASSQIPSPDQAQESPLNMFRQSEGRWGSREVEIVEVLLMGDHEKPRHLFHSGERMTVRLKINAIQPVKDFVFGVSIFNLEGICCYGTNTDIDQLKPYELAGSGEVMFMIESLDLVEGTYKLDVAVHKQDGYPYDYHRLLYTFRVKSSTKDVGIYKPHHRWKFSPNVNFTEILTS